MEHVGVGHSLGPYPLEVGVTGLHQDLRAPVTLGGVDPLEELALHLLHG
ncbi:MAG TPA: hypothetical protein VKB17_07035 [Thermoleophilaceae bacterium]|nr:hypothetical protein [Thermoleophilaceae bacterium]